MSGHLAEGTWQEFRLFSGHAIAAHCQAAPHTAELVASIPGATTAGLVYLAYVAPGTHVRPHWGPHNARLRCHLGLVVPDGCSLRVGARTGGWTEGRVTIFDDSYEHEVRNAGEARRAGAAHGRVASRPLAGADPQRSATGTCPSSQWHVKSPRAGGATGRCPG